MADDQKPSDNETDPMLQYFCWKHLPPHLQEVSRHFGVLAAKIVRTTRRSAERTAALRKLREAKDCAVTASLPERTTTTSDLE